MTSEEQHYVIPLNNTRDHDSSEIGSTDLLVMFSLALVSLGRTGGYDGNFMGWCG